MNVAVEKKIQVGFGIALVFLLLVAAAAGWSGQRHLETFRAVDHTHRVLSKLEEVLVDILNTETGARGFAISGDEVFLKPYESGMASVRKSFEDVRRLTRDDPKQQRQLEALRPLLERKLDHVAAMLALRRAGDTEALRQFVSKGEGNQLMSEIRSGLGAMRAEEMLLVQQRTARAQTLTRATLGLAICGSVLALVLVGLASLVVSRDFQQRRQVETALADSETRFRILFEQSPDPCWLINERNLFAACNHAAVQALGYKNREELLATHPAELSPAVQPDGSLSHKKADEMMALAHQSGIHRFEWEHRRVNGQVFPVEVTLAKTQVHGQQMLYAVWRDISARKQTEFLTREQLQLEAFAAAIGKALNSSEELNVMLARCTEAMVTHLDAAFARIWTLNEVEQLLELQASSGLYTHLNGPHGRVPVGKFKIGLIAQERKPHLTNQVVGDPRVGDQEWARREGMVAFAGYPLIAGDRLVGVLAMFARHKLDKFALTALGTVADHIAVGIERKRAEGEIRRLNDDLLRQASQVEQANRELTAFAYVVSHDLKAPLRGIGSLASWLVTDYADKLDDAGRENLALLTSRVTRLNALIDGILAYSRAGRSREERCPVDLDHVGRNVAEMLAPPAHIGIEFETPLPCVLAEPTKMQQVFQNLLSNAIKFMDKPAGRIRVRCDADDGQWHFQVADNGPGIEEKYFDRIFQLFQTLAPRDEVEGTGVGLALVKKIIEHEGGRVWVTSKPGGGSTFHFTLPRPADEHPTISSISKHEA